MKKSLVIGVVLMMSLSFIIAGKPALGKTGICDDEGIPCIGKLEGTCVKLPFPEKVFIPTGLCENCVDNNCVEEDDELMIKCAVGCDGDKCEQILDDDKKDAAKEQYCLKDRCDSDVSWCQELVDDENFLAKLALLNAGEEREVSVRITADNKFKFYLNGVEQLSGSKWDKLFEKDIKISEGDVVLIYAWDKELKKGKSGGNRWLVFEAIDKETGELMFWSDDSWIVYHGYPYMDEDILVKDAKEYSSRLINGNFESDEIFYGNHFYFDVVEMNGFSKITNQLIGENTKFIWGHSIYYNAGYAGGREPQDGGNNVAFYVGKRIKFPEEFE